VECNGKGENEDESGQVFQLLAKSEESDRDRSSNQLLVTVEGLVCLFHSLLLASEVSCS
jgi:hypothetical protein